MNLEYSSKEKSFFIILNIFFVFMLIDLFLLFNAFIEKNFLKICINVPIFFMIFMTYFGMMLVQMRKKRIISKGEKRSAYIVGVLEKTHRTRKGKYYSHHLILDIDGENLEIGNIKNNEAFRFLYNVVYNRGKDPECDNIKIPIEVYDLKWGTFSDDGIYAVLDSVNLEDFFKMEDYNRKEKI